MPNAKYDIYERIFRFIVLVIRLIKTLPRSEENLIIVRQVLRSTTSMGANSQEADGVSSKKDFLHCLTTVRKESKETLFWLRLVVELNQGSRTEGNELIQECSEIIAIVSKIISNSRT